MSVPTTYWKALFDFANRAGSSDPVNAPDSSGDALRVMSPQDRKWLEEAMQEYVHSADPIKQMKGCLESLMVIQTEHPSDNQMEAAVDALERLQDMCADIDLSKDFFNIGGVRLLPFLLSSGNLDIKKETLGLIGELSQNHPYSQEQLYIVGVLPVLLNIVQYEADDAFKSRAVFALSSLIRGHQALEQDFVNADGLQILTNVLASSTKEHTYRSGSKIAFLLQTLADHPAFNAEMVSNQHLDSICIGLLLGVNDVRESTLAAAFNERILALLCKVCTDVTIVDDVHKQMLYDISKLDEDESYQDQKEHALNVLGILGCDT